MRFLVLGAGGMAGHMVAIYLAERGHDVTGLARRPLPFLGTVIECDALDDGRLAEVVREGSYDVVVNAVGILNADAEERHALAAYVNGYLPHRLVEMAEGLPTRVFHLSTDCVFAGNGGPYSEASVPDGRTFYDRSKALGEIDDGRNLTLRQSIVGPDVNERGIGLLNWFMGQEGPVSGYSHAIWTGLTTLELARAIEACADDGSAGLVNMVPPESISKYGLLCLFNEQLRGGRVRVEPVDEPRLDKALVRTNETPSFRPALYETQVRERAAWMRAHAGLYPHYRLERE